MRLSRDDIKIIRESLTHSFKDAENSLKKFNRKSQKKQAITDAKSPGTWEPESISQRQESISQRPESISKLHELKASMSYMPL